MLTMIPDALQISVSVTQGVLEYFAYKIFLSKMLKSEKGLLLPLEESDKEMKVGQLMFHKQWVYQISKS